MTSTQRRDKGFGLFGIVAHFALPAGERQQGMMAHGPPGYYLQADVNLCNPHSYARENKEAECLLHMNNMNNVNIRMNSKLKVNM